MTGEGAPRRRVTHQERRERRAAVDDPAVVLEAAARFLEVRARSVAEVRRRLTSTGYQPDLVEGAVERLLDLGLLDDEAFARAWVESRDRARPRGERAIRQELGLKGVDRITVDLVLARAPRSRGRRRPMRTASCVGRSGRGRTSAVPQRAQPRARRRPTSASPARVRVARPQRLRSRGLPQRGRDRSASNLRISAPEDDV